MKITNQCLNCNIDYIAEEKYLKRGQGRFCSQRCSGLYQASARPKQLPNTICSYCNKQFYKTNSSKKQSKSGLFFCCRDHKDLAQRIGGIEAIQTSHYNSLASVNYRSIAFRSLPNECSRCGWDKIPEILEVNHIDIDHSNNCLSNLEILCPTCHREFHYLTKTGFWRNRQ